MRFVCLFAFLCAPLVAACSGSSGPTGEFTIANQRLTLEGVGNACYGLTVKNGLGQVVWQKSNVCADTYGNQTSDITFIGTCDASAGAQLNTVELVIEGLYEDDGDPVAFVNPAPAGAPIVQTKICLENQDQRVDFNVVVARPAGQGFVDAVVNFEDVFCSAKLDCSENALVHDPVSGERIDSAVLAFACTGGVGADTHMYWSDVEITCGTTTTVVPLDGEPGKIWSATNPAPAPLRQAILYRGLEELTQDDESLGKAYFSVALGMDLESVAGPCTISMRATASDGAFDACTTPVGAIYPVINVDRAFIADGAFACGQHAVDRVPGADIWTSYTLAGPVAFTNEASAQGDDFVVESCAPPSITLTSNDSSFDELGDVARVNVRLSRAPLSPVTVPVSVSAGSAVASVVLDGNNWNSGVDVVVSGVDDRIQHANIAVTFTAGASSSGDVRFAALSATTGLVFVQNGTYCGDGVRQSGEACDGNDNPSTCVSTGHDAGAIGCTAGCVVDEGACTDCGDGTIDANEQCDGNTVACDTLGFSDGDAACTASCTFDTSACTTCGNDDQEGNEDCDGEDLAGASCVSLGYVGGALACDVCIFDEAGCETAICGNGAIEFGEQCDPPNVPSSCGYGQTCAACSAQCQSGSIQGPSCGDGVANGPEACDGADVPTCAELDAGNPFGTVTCTGGCALSASCSNDACAGQPTVINGDVTLNGYAAPAGIVAPQCVTRINGTLNINGPFMGPAVIHFPNLVTQAANGGGVGQININAWPAGVALLPELTYSRSLTAFSLSNTNVVMPELRRQAAGGGRVPLSTGANVVWDMPLIERIQTFGATSTFNFGPNLDSAELIGSGTFNIPANVTSIAVVVASGTVTFNAPGVTSIGTFSTNGGTIIGLAQLTTFGVGASGQLLNVNFPNVTSITGGTTAQFYNDTSLPSLQTVAGPVSCNGNATLPSTLVSVGGLSMANLSIPSFTASGLVTINGPLSLNNNTALATLSLPALTTVTGSFAITRNTALPVATANAIRAQITTGPTTTSICGNQGDVACP